MAHLVKCLYCGATFDESLSPAIKVNQRRYAHKECYDKHQAEKTQEEKSKEKLIAYIKQIFNCNTLSPKINKQLRDFIAVNKYTYSGILGTLKYCIEVKKNPVEKMNGGVGIVGYLYEEARRYYLDLAEARDRNQEIIEKQEIQELPPIEVYITPPVRRPMKNIRPLFTFLEKEED